LKIVETTFHKPDALAVVRRETIDGHCCKKFLGFSGVFCRHVLAVCSAGENTAGRGAGRA